MTLYTDSVATSVESIPMWLNLREATGASEVFTELSLGTMREVAPKKRSTFLSFPFSGKPIASHQFMQAITHPALVSKNTSASFLLKL